MSLKRVVILHPLGRQQVFSFSYLYLCTSLSFPSCFHSQYSLFRESNWSLQLLCAWPGRPLLTTFTLHFLCQKGPTGWLLDQLSSSPWSTDHFWVHRWMDLLGVLVCCAEALFFPFVMDVWSVVNQGGEKRDDSCYHDVGFCNGFKCKSTLKHKIWNLFGAFYKKLLMWLLFCVCYFLNDISSTYFTFLKSLILYSIRQTMKDIDPILKTVS